MSYDCNVYEKACAVSKSNLRQITRQVHQAGNQKHIPRGGTIHVKSQVSFTSGDVGQVTEPLRGFTFLSVGE